MPDEEKYIALRIPSWLYRALILALLAGTWGLVKYAWDELQGNIDSKVEQKAFDEWKQGVNRQLESLWRRR